MSPGLYNKDTQELEFGLTVDLEALKTVGVARFDYGVNSILN